MHGVLRNGTATIAGFLFFELPPEAEEENYMLCKELSYYTRRASLYNLSFA